MNANDVRCPLCQATDYRLDFTWQDYQLVRCNICGLVYATPFGVPPDLYDKAYGTNNDYGSYIESAEANDNHLSWAMRLFFVNARHSGHLLDVGCSTGGFMLNAQQRGWTVQGIEISERAAQIARDRTGATVVTQTIDQFSTTEQFDAITMWEVLEHLPDPVGAVDKVVSMLRPGGYFAGSVPNWASPWMRLSNHRVHWPPYHLTYWERDPMQRLLTYAGLKGVRISQKPFAWTEELGAMKVILLPLSIARSALLGQRGIHLFFIGQKH